MDVSWLKMQLPITSATTARALSAPLAAAAVTLTASTASVSASHGPALDYVRAAVEQVDDYALSGMHETTRPMAMLRASTMCGVRMPHSPAAFESMSNDMLRAFGAFADPRVPESTFTVARAIATGELQRQDVPTIYVTKEGGDLAMAFFNLLKTAGFPVSEPYRVSAAMLRSSDARDPGRLVDAAFESGRNMGFIIIDEADCLATDAYVSVRSSIQKRLTDVDGPIVVFASRSDVRAFVANT